MAGPRHGAPASTTSTTRAPWSPPTAPSARSSGQPAGSAEPCRSYGTTTIRVTGPAGDRAALRNALAATATDKLGFSLAAIAPDLWRADGLLCDAEIEGDEDALQLRATLVYSNDCVDLGGSPAPRFPSLRFDAWFDSEARWPNFAVSAHEGGQRLYQAWFDTTLLAEITTAPGASIAIPFFEWTAERDTAASDRLRDSLKPFLSRPPAVGAWRRSDGTGADSVFLLLDGDTDGHLVLAYQASRDMGEIMLLRDVATHGGYRVAEHMALTDAAARLPDLAGEVALIQADIDEDRAAATTAVDPTTRSSSDPIAPPPVPPLEKGRSLCPPVLNSLA